MSNTSNSTGIFYRYFVGDIGRFRANAIGAAREMGYKDDNPVTVPIISGTASNSYSRSLERYVYVGRVAPDIKFRDLAWIPMDPTDANYGKVMQYWGDGLTLSVIDDSTAIWNDYTFEGTRPY